MTRLALDEIAAIEAIRLLKARYCRYFDLKQWDRLSGLFAPGARVEGFSSVPDGTDISVFIERVSARLGAAVTIHHVTAPEIVVQGVDAARGIWAVADYVDLGPDHVGYGNASERGWRGWGYYEEAYVCQDGTWRIGFMRLVRQRMTPLMADHLRAQPGRIKPSPDWL
ncbi:MAG: nuclear transport factor 2 family protein [Hyphomicrobiaceae bacterium]